MVIGGPWTWETHRVSRGPPSAYTPPGRSGRSPAEPYPPGRQTGSRDLQVISVLSVTKFVVGLSADDERVEVVVSCRESGDRDGLGGH